MWEWAHSAVGQSTEEPVQNPNGEKITGHELDLRHKRGRNPCHTPDLRPEGDHWGPTGGKLPSTYQKTVPIDGDKDREYGWRCTSRGEWPGSHHNCWGPRLGTAGACCPPSWGNDTQTDGLNTEQQPRNPQEQETRPSWSYIHGPIHHMAGNHLQRSQTSHPPLQ